MNLLITDLSPLAWLRVRGEDAVSFLQGQLSNDVTQLRETRGQLSSYNNPKGRMLAVLQLSRRDDEILLELPASLRDPTLARLKMFVLRAKVQLSAAEDLAALGLIGDEAPALLAALDLPCPAQPQDCASTPAGLQVLRRLGERPRFSILGPAAALDALRARLPAGRGNAASYEAWRRADIEAGVPVVLPQTREHFVPQMANLDLLGGISLNKGCYTGQEIVARLHYLGQLKRRLFVARIQGAAPAPGNEVHAAGEEQAVGEVVDAVDSGDGSALASLVLQLSQRDAALRVADAPALVLSGPAAAAD